MSGGGISIGRDCSPIIINCNISENKAGAGGAGIGIQYHSTVFIINSTISNNWIVNAPITNGAGIAVQFNNVPVTIINSIIWGNTPGEIEIVASENPLITYSDVKGGWSGEGNIDLDPIFAYLGDYHLTFDSPCIDRGTNNGAPDDDFDGEYRPQGVEVDIGADEYNFSDFDQDRDVDGTDLSKFASEYQNITYITLTEFASNFGRQTKMDLNLMTRLSLYKFTKDKRF